MTCDRCGLEVLAAMYGDTGTLHHPKTCIERLKAEAQRWRDAHDKIIAYAADVEEKAKESIAEVEAENERLKDAVEEEQEIANAFREPCVPLLKRINTLEAENAALHEDKARLVEALEKIAEGHWVACVDAYQREDCRRWGNFSTREEATAAATKARAEINDCTARSYADYVLEMDGEEVRAAIDAARKESR